MQSPLHVTLTSCMTPTLTLLHITCLLHVLPASSRPMPLPISQDPKIDACTPLCKEDNLDIQQQQPDSPMYQCALQRGCDDMDNNSTVVNNTTLYQDCVLDCSDIAARCFDFCIESYDLLMPKCFEEEYTGLETDLQLWQREKLNPCFARKLIARLLNDSTTALDNPSTTTLTPPSEPVSTTTTYVTVLNSNTTSHDFKTVNSSLSYDSTKTTSIDDNPSHTATLSSNTNKHFLTTTTTTTLSSTESPVTMTTVTESPVTMTTVTESPVTMTTATVSPPTKPYNATTSISPKETEKPGTMSAHTVTPPTKSTQSGHTDTDIQTTTTQPPTTTEYSVRPNKIDVGNHHNIDVVPLDSYDTVTPPGGNIESNATTADPATTVTSNSDFTTDLGNNAINNNNNNNDTITQTTNTSAPVIIGNFNDPGVWWRRLKIMPFLAGSAAGIVEQEQSINANRSTTARPDATTTTTYTTTTPRVHADVTKETTKSPVFLDNPPDEVTPVIVDAEVKMGNMLEYNGGYNRDRERVFAED